MALVLSQNLSSGELAYLEHVEYDALTYAVPLGNKMSSKSMFEVTSTKKTIYLNTNLDFEYRDEIVGKIESHLKFLRDNMKRKQKLLEKRRNW